MDQHKVFNDPVHGHIEMHPLCMRIIDTPQFQRLRYIKQLGTCYFVFPGASHNRFEHSLGVAFLAGELVRQLRSKQPDLGITDKDILCVGIAGLCHDLGHGPFSHMFDNVFIPKVRGNKNWKHEEASVKMFNYLVEMNGLDKEFEHYGLKTEDLTFITEQIAGPSKGGPGEKQVHWPYRGRPEEKGFLYEVVANKRNGIDVDKWDYFARDCHHLGIRSNFDHNRFMKFARVLKVDGQLQICSRDKEVGNCYDMFYTRNVLHRRAYQHKNAKVIDCMITEALLLANEHLKFMNDKGVLLKLSDTIEDMSAYMKVDDRILYVIMHSADTKLRDAQKILEMVERRQLYRCIGQVKPSQPNIIQDSEEEMSRKITEYSHEISPSKTLDPSDVIVQVIHYDYGMREANPVDHVRFYSKSNPKQPIHVKKNQVSEMLPETFSEKLVRVYCRNRDEDTVSLATKCFEHFCKANGLMQPKAADTGLVEMSPDKMSCETQVASADLPAKKQIQF